MSSKQHNILTTAMSNKHHDMLTTAMSTKHRNILTTKHHNIFRKTNTTCSAELSLLSKAKEIKRNILWCHCIYTLIYQLDFLPTGLSMAYKGYQ
jgi:hypothetical protein